MSPLSVFRMYECFACIYVSALCACLVCEGHRLLLIMVKVHDTKFTMKPNFNHTVSIVRYNQLIVETAFIFHFYPNFPPNLMKLLNATLFFPVCIYVWLQEQRTTCRSRFSCLVSLGIKLRSDLAARALSSVSLPQPVCPS